MNLFCVICRKKKRECLKAWQAASSTPCSRGGNVDIGKRRSLQANGKSMCKKIGWLLKSPSFAFGFACTTLNRCMLFKSLFVVVDFHLCLYNLFWYLFCTKITLAIWVIHHHRQVFPLWMVVLLCLGKRAKTEKTAKVMHQTTRKTPRKGLPKMTLENQRTSSELIFELLIYLLTL